MFARLSVGGRREGVQCSEETPGEKTPAGVPFVRAPRGHRFRFSALTLKRGEPPLEKGRLQWHCV